MPELGAAARVGDLSKVTANFIIDSNSLDICLQLYSDATFHALGMIARGCAGVESLELLLNRKPKPVN
jgi:hypothetical protein